MKKFSIACKEFGFGKSCSFVAAEETIDQAKDKLTEHMKTHPDFARLPEAEVLNFRRLVNDRLLDR